MSRKKIGSVLSILLIACLPMCAAAQKDQPSSKSGDFDRQLATARALYSKAKTEDAVIMVSKILAEQKLTPDQESKALLVLAAAEASRGQDGQAKAYLQRLAALDPAIELNADEHPPQMMRLWYMVEKDIPADQRQIPTKLSTIAVMSFDNESISDDREKLDPLSKGLASMMIQDIAKTGKLRVVERDRINFLIDELKLQSSEMIDQNTAVKMGKLVGAHQILMGGFMKMNAKEFRIMGRLVSVETGEIIRAEEVTGSPKKLVELQKELVFKILSDLNVDVDQNTQKEINRGRDTNYDALYHYSLGLALEDKKDYKGAYAEYEKALKLAPEYSDAVRKRDRLEPLALQG